MFADNVLFKQLGKDKTLALAISNVPSTPITHIRKNYL